LLATDHKNSVLSEIESGRKNQMAYSAYGHQSTEQNVVSRLGFNGGLREAFHWYFLGNGYRVYNPRLMRFHSPDSWSPFGAGGLNAYMYCLGNPVNASDPTGHMPFFKKLFSRNPISRTSSTSSVDRLIPITPPPVRRRTGPLPSITEHTSLPNAGGPLDPSTGENIFEVLPAGRRNWTPPSASEAPAEMMTFAEFSQQQSSAGRSSTPTSVNALPPAPLVDRSTKPAKMAKARWDALRNQDQKNADLNPATRLLPPPPPKFGVDSKGLEWVDLGVYNPDKETLDKYNSIIRKQT
jgi:RHS repeat-associated protein